MHEISALVVLVILVLSEAFYPIPPKVLVPKPYKFGYTVKDKHGEQHREETGDGVGVVKGSYGFTDERGIYRQVNYIADKAGFRAEVKTNEHGTAPFDPAAVKMISSAHPYFGGAGGPNFLAAGPGPLASKAAAFGVPPVVPGFDTGYGVPLLGGSVKGYDSRFGIV